jgi:putative membrane protein
MQLVIRWLVNAAALFIAVSLLPGLHFEGTPVQFLAVAAVFGLVNALLRPILTLLSCPLIVLTLGLFTLVLNGALLLVTSWLSDKWHLGFHVDGWLPAILGGLIIGLVSTALTITVGERSVKNREVNRL